MTRSRWVVVLVPASVYVWEWVGPHGCSHRAPQREEVFDLLAKNYVEDDDNVFRFCYSPEFLTWALTPPGYFPEWLVGVRQSSNQRLRGFISGIPTTTHVYDRCVSTQLCVLAMPYSPGIPTTGRRRCARSTSSVSIRSCDPCALRQCSSRR